MPLPYRRPSTARRRVAFALLCACLPSVGATQAPSKEGVAPLDEAEFERALPPLDETAPAEAPVPPPAQTPAPELEAPLPPLAGFDPAPLAIAADTAAQDADPKPMRYGVEVTGLKPLGLEARFRALSALLHDGRKAANATQIRARANEDVGLAERLLRSDGYYDAVASAQLPAGATPDAVVPVTIIATPGDRYTLDSIALTGLAAEPHRLAEDALALHGGDPIVAAAIEEAEARVALRLPQAGYPFVAVGQRDVVLDPATHRGDYTLPVDAGPRRASASSPQRAIQCSGSIISPSSRGSRRASFMTAARSTICARR